MRVVVHDLLTHDGPVQPDPEILLTWATRDLDRAMLFATEIVVEVAAKP